MAETSTIRVQCCIAGGGPAGMMLGFLLARAGVEVLVLEKHGDFLRDFRGDTIHPSTLEVIHELGLLDAFLALPHQEMRELAAQVGEHRVRVADFSHLPVRCPFIAMIPQWDFLDFLASQGRRYPSFALRMNTETTDLVEEAGRVVGLRAETREGAIEIRADLVVGADGRHSTLRERAGLEIEAFGAPMDVFWFALSRRADDPEQTLGRAEPGHIFVLINRGAHWQCGFVIPKGAAVEIRARGLAAFRAEVGRLVPFEAARAEELRDWEQVKLLTVAVDRLRRWHRPGLLCIGDAAHAMSPVGGVGINLAIQDAVAAANLLAAPLREGRLAEADLASVQRRREWPARMTQRVQLAVQKRIITRVLGSGSARFSPPFVVRLLDRFAVLRRLPGRLVGMGFRPEHVGSALSSRHGTDAVR